MPDFDVLGVGQGVGSEFMLKNPEQQHEGLPLTREEARRVLRVNETTLDSWLRTGRLDSVGYDDGGHRESMIIVRDEQLIERVEERMDKAPIDLTVDLLPARARHQLLRMMMSRKSARTMFKRRVQHPFARAVPRPGRQRRRFESRRTVPVVRDEESQHQIARLETREEARIRRSRTVSKAIQKTRSNRRRIVRHRGKVSRKGFDASDELIDLMFPPERLPKRRRRPAKTEDLSALEELVATSDKPEGLWGEELLGLVSATAETLAQEVDDLLEHGSPELSEDDEIEGEGQYVATDAAEFEAVDAHSEDDEVDAAEYVDESAPAEDDYEFLVEVEESEDVSETDLVEIPADQTTVEFESGEEGEGEVVETPVVAEAAADERAQVFEPCAGDRLPVELSWDREDEDDEYGFDPDGPRVFSVEYEPVPQDEPAPPEVGSICPVDSHGVPENVVDDDLDSEVELLLEERLAAEFSTVVDEDGSVPPRPRSQVFDWTGDPQEEQVEAVESEESEEGEDLAVTEDLEEGEDLAVTEDLEEGEDLAVTDDLEAEDPAATEDVEEQEDVLLEADVDSADLDESEAADEPEEFDTAHAKALSLVADELLDSDLFAESVTDMAPSSEFELGDVEMGLGFDDEDEFSAAADAKGSVFAGQAEAARAAFAFSDPVEMPEPVIAAEEMLSMSLASRSSKAGVPISDSDIIPTDEELAELLASPVVLSHGATNLLADAETSVVLRSIEEGVDKLASVVDALYRAQDGPDDSPDLQPIIDAIREDLSSSRETDSITLSLSRVAEQVAEIHDEVRASKKVALSSVSVVREIRQDVERDLLVRRVLSGAGVAHAKSEDEGAGVSTLMIGMAVVLMTWAVTFYVKTGDLQLTLGALVVANLVGCATILYTKTGRVL